MKLFVRPLVVFGASMALGTLSVQLVWPDHPVGTGPMEAAAFNLGGGYDLARLQLLKETLGYVTETYVEPGRVDFERMFVASLEAVERDVPETMFSREDGLLHLHIGDYRQSRRVPHIASDRALVEELKVVAHLIQEHLELADIPGDADELNPFARIEYLMVNGALETLDPHSVLLPPEQSNAMDVDNQGEFGGLGITIVDREGRLTIEYPLADTPADEAGLQPDDVITRIDGESTINMTLDEAVKRLRGLVGSPVEIEIRRDGEDDPLTVTIVRDRIKLNPVEGDVLEGGFGYVAIPSFHTKASTDLRDLLARMSRDTGGLRGLILDLRGNPGGYLNQAIQVADVFLEDGEVVTTDGPSQRRKVERAKIDAEDPYPMVVLVNANSASASEIVAGALRNNERAVIVGERTFGKGSVQNLHEMLYDSKLKITVAQYFTPGERSIQSVGIPADIELVPSIVESAAASEKRDRDFALMFYRERVRREADLDKHLERTDFQHEESAAYSIRHLADSDRRRRRSGDLDLSDDYEVQFALDLLSAARSPRRSEMLLAAAPVVERHRQAAAVRIEAAFAGIGIDWSNGPSLDRASLEVSLDLGDDDTLVAGEEEVVALEVTNVGTEPVYRLAAIGKDHPVFGAREFIFGRLNPGETRRYEHRVAVDAGYPAETTKALFTFRDGENLDLGSESATVSVRHRPLPRFSWSWEVTSRDGGPLHVGNEVLVKLDVVNIGGGSTVGAVARIRNQSGKALDIISGTVEPGFMVDADGELCAVLEPGIEAETLVGVAEDPAAVWERRDPPTYASDCHRELGPGQSWSGAFAAQLKEPQSGGYVLDLSLGDAESYDVGTIARSGFYSYFMQDEEVWFQTGKPEGPTVTRVPPSIEITRAPGAMVDGNRVAISGVVKDDVGLANVVVYAGENKAFFEGSRPGFEVRQVPFTAEVELEPGANVISVLTTDVDGFTSTESVVVYYESPESHAVLDPE